MRETDYSAGITDLVSETRAGDTVTAKTKKNNYVNEQKVCEVHEVDGGKIVCITVGGEIPMMILETISHETYTNAYTYKNESFQHLGRLREYGVEGHPKTKDYDAEGWLDVNEFVSEIKN